MEKFRKSICPFGIWQFLLANLGLAIFITIIFFHGAYKSIPNFLLGVAWAYFICITQWTGLSWINYIMDDKIRWIERPVTRSIVEIILLVLYSTIAFSLVQIIMLYLVHRVNPLEAWGMIAGSLIYTMLISFTISLIFTAAGFFRAWKRELIRSEKFKSEMLAYKYESLRNQLNPHFLFNSLNVLSDLVYADQAQAVKFIQQLSGLFRYVLDSREKELVKLQEEKDFLQSFIFLLKTRFEDKLEIQLDFSASPEDLIVPMTLQLLVENAVKHNEVSEKFPLKVSIRKEEQSLVVENNLQLKVAGETSKGTGLQNIEQQFSFFTDRKIEIMNSDGNFTVRVPILKAAEK
ncbi:MAG: histidine kinase [Bacteroidetes bacterium]|nr:histidine kinase [Bacteroidota bacterium]